MKATRETSIVYAGRQRTVYSLSRPLTDRDFPKVSLVMVWGQDGEYLSPCDMKAQVTDYTPVVADAAVVRAAIAECDRPRNNSPISGVECEYASPVKTLS